MSENAERAAPVSLLQNVASILRQADMVVRTAGNERLSTSIHDILADVERVLHNDGP